ncbi:DUF4010 domain-containing protein [uncultured Piscinibacter sp.]|uniref:MgtC/SapB family protein n=1 Tax=uncultured Piscinibacter sp. TaxID=1131835 RepID=UPI00262A1509|nr:DUF4010 domain-containing protein [uncultured Piscinibacter sp.]
MALGCGLLIGLERERRKGEGDDRAAAGVRTFSIAALLGALSESLAVPGLVLGGALLVGLMAALSYARSRSRDPGLTTELALAATYLVGVLSVRSPLLGAACGTTLAVLLAARMQLHHFATKWLSQRELHDGLMLAGIALVLLPLVPDEPLPWLAGMRARPLASLVLLILVLQAAGHVALRLFGARFGMAASGFFGGFVSSTATVAAFGARARSDHVPAALAAAAGALSGCATWVQMLALAAALSRPALALLWWPAMAGLGGTLAVAALWSFGPGRDAQAPVIGERGALRLREALLVALMLAGVALLVGRAQQRFGTGGALASAALAALADAHAPIASLLSLFAAAQIDARTMLGGVLLALGSNTTMRLVTAFASGGTTYALRVGSALVAGLAAAVTTALLAA